MGLGLSKKKTKTIKILGSGHRCFGRLVADWRGEPRSLSVHFWGFEWRPRFGLFRAEAPEDLVVRGRSPLSLEGLGGAKFLKLRQLFRLSEFRRELWSQAQTPNPYRARIMLPTSFIFGSA